jgi:hypothetical protein
VSKTPVLLQLKSSLNGIEASQRDQKFADTTQMRITMEIKQAIDDVNEKLAKELQPMLARDDAQNQAIVQRFDNLHAAIDRLKSSIRESALGETLTKQHEMTQVCQFTLEMRIEQLRRSIDTRASNQSLFRWSLNWATIALTHVATGIGAAGLVGRQLQDVVSRSPSAVTEHSLPSRPNQQPVAPACSKTFDGINHLTCV